MKKSISTKEIEALKKALEAEELVIVGGCFDILHEGHMAFLSAAKEEGSMLVLLLESDEAVTTRKGKGRPVNTQQKRAENLLSKTATDIIVLLPFPFSNSDYDQLVTTLKPAIIATTKGDPYLHHKNRQAGLIGSRVVEVIERIPGYSTTQEIIQMYE